MDIVQGIHRIRQILADSDMPNDQKLQIIGYSLPDKDKEYQFHSTKDLCIRQAKDSGKSKFKLLATMNNQINIFQWNNEEYNFVGMCPNGDYPQNPDEVIYSLEELPEVIDYAEQWLKRGKETFGNSGSPYFFSDLQIMALD